MALPQHDDLPPFLYKPIPLDTTRRTRPRPSPAALAYRGVRRREWWKRLAVLVVIAAWAVAAREIAVGYYGLTKWAVTGISVAIFFVAFWLADQASPLGTRPPSHE